jgi:4-hydroxy-tetrahydrodipicolinate reductase
MGQRIVALAAADKSLSVAAALEFAQHACLGQDAGLIAGAGELGVRLAARLETDVDVVIDFSTPVSAMAMAETCLTRRLPLVVATTGFSADQRDRLRELSGLIPLLWAPSMSLAVNLAMKLSAVAAKALADHPTGADVEIIERHHRFKEDAPSGTALKFGEIITREMGQTVARHGRDGRPGERPHAEIGYHAVRAGDHPGEHTIMFGLLGETLEITVRATNRDCYAHGALTAAKFLVGKPAGLYGMHDVLGL